MTPLLPLYQADFHLTNGQVTLLFATYTLTVVPTMLIFGVCPTGSGARR